MSLLCFVDFTYKKSFFKAARVKTSCFGGTLDLDRFHWRKEARLFYYYYYLGEVTL